MKLFTRIQFEQLLDLRRSYSSLPVGELQMIGTNKIAKSIIAQYDITHSIVVFAGSGNNGGDSIHVAIHLIEEGYDTQVFLINPLGRLSDYCVDARRQLIEQRPDLLTEITGAFRPPVIVEKCIIIDGLLGSGINRPLGGGYLGLVRFINASGATVLSIDFPTGIQSEEEEMFEEIGESVHAQRTYQYHTPRLQSLMPEYQEAFGKVEIIDIEIPERANNSADSSYVLFDKSFIAPMILPRDEFGEKRDFGHALLIGGKEGMAGAVIAAAHAALRSGVGLLTAQVPQSVLQSMQVNIPEATCFHDGSHTVISQIDYSTKYQAVAIGPGMGTDAVTMKAVSKFFEENRSPIVIDADALNLLAINQSLFKKFNYPAVLTPHIREFDRIFGDQPNTWTRIEMSRQLCAQLKCVIVLKGRYTAVIGPDGSVSFNSSGNSALAKGGSGDVLTGMILAFLAQGYSIEQSATIAVYLHGAAGDRAAQSDSPISVLSSDVCKQIGAAYCDLFR